MNRSKVNGKFFKYVGISILVFFISISVVSLIDDNKYYNSMDIIKGIDYIDKKLVITTSDDIKSVCVKETKSIPTNNSLCWIKVIDNKSETSIYEYKTYHIWVMDSSDIITYYGKYNVE